MPAGHVWGDAAAAAGGGAGAEAASVEEMWRRLEWFLTRLVPVAEEAGVRLYRRGQHRPCVDLDQRIALCPYILWETIVYLDRIMHSLWCFSIGNWPFRVKRSNFPIYSIIPY